MALAMILRSVEQRLIRPLSRQGAKRVGVSEVNPYPIRSVTSTETGAIIEEPERIPLGMFKIIMTVIPGLYIGATLSKTGAAFLEENDIFVPDDDDDDDY